MKLTPRQEEIVKLVKEEAPITSEALASKLGVTRAALRPDLAVLTMIGMLSAKPKVGYVCSEKSSNNLVLEKLSNIKVGDIMSKPSVISEDTMVHDAIVYLFLKDVGTIFVENNGQLTGAVSRKDFLKVAIGGTDIYKVPVGVIMTRMPNIISANVEDSAFEVASKIINHEIDSIPVVEEMKNDDGEVYLKIIGKVSKTNITKLFVKLGKIE
ncbi:helix-turn-helix transcriptional regulator [Clostridium mediterraneense]|uniref:helix-turn-helix transcriptional regulator n=1 Tax=Clostridium mediterraneense TaxID=1805472 RepID=UPI0008312A3C|nr:helix-turn-helix transcriptional regulator [Clostridium mediterraneense]